VSVVVALGCVLLVVLAIAPARRGPARVLVPAPVRRLRAARHERRSTHPLVDVLDAMSRDIRSGVSFRSALLDALADDPQVLPDARAALSAGRAVDEALGLEAATSGDQALFVHALRVAARTGGAAGDTLDRTASVLRERLAWRDERRAQSAQARLSARVLTVLPPVVCGWGLLTSGRVRTAYATSSFALLLGAVGVALNLAGWWWMRQLVDAGDDA
jgi:tight adherence protein B